MPLVQVLPQASMKDVWSAALAAHVWAELMIGASTNRFTMRKLPYWQHPPIGHSNFATQDHQLRLVGETCFVPLKSGASNQSGPSFCVHSPTRTDIGFALTT